ncbi:MAG TPA: SdpI family protein [Smithella sp.]|nr:SdpI family protein [Smithella sp.]MDM7987904.1 SdpI family protein [Smithella sp.]HNY50589.1 SdpI family protein [Smithella sp.]HOG89156.1 SdpI family protein [Smithella sp.]HOU51698.1 SdpI family protein [Smithella sp.]
MMLKALITILICDFIFAVIAVPLFLRKVPRNVIYGFRIKATLKNDSVWYEANAYFGKLLIISSLISALLMIMLYFANFLLIQNFMYASIALLVVPSLAATLLTLRHIKTIQQ